ncbi:hypothetical protein [Enterococcus olivae]
MTEQVKDGVMQILLKNGVNVQIGVHGESEFKMKKDSLLKSTKEFVTIIDTCTIRKEDISLIEYFPLDKTAGIDEKEETETKKGGWLKWLRK